MAFFNSLAGGTIGRSATPGGVRNMPQGADRGLMNMTGAPNVGMTRFGSPMNRPMGQPMNMGVNTAPTNYPQPPTGNVVPPPPPPAMGVNTSPTNVPVIGNVAPGPSFPQNPMMGIRAPMNNNDPRRRY